MLKIMYNFPKHHSNAQLCVGLSQKIHMVLNCLTYTGILKLRNITQDSIYSCTCKTKITAISIIKVISIILWLQLNQENVT